MTNKEALCMLDMIINHFNNKPMYYEYLTSLTELREELSLSILAQEYEDREKEYLSLEMPKFFYE